MQSNARNAINTRLGVWKQAVKQRISSRITESAYLKRTFDRRTPRFDMMFTDIWQMYLRQNGAEVPSKITRLCEGMDDVSAEIVGSITDRYFYMAPACRFDEVVRYRPDLLFTEYEKGLQKQFRHLMSTRTGSYVLPEGYSDPAVSVFACRNGLDFVPDAKERLNGTIAIDGGAFIGDSALVLSEFNFREIYCFEPNAANSKALGRTLELNRLRNVHIEEAGLGDIETVASLSGGHSVGSLVIDDQSGANIRVRRIDDYCLEHGIAAGLIKLDIEGMEFAAISGARKTIETHKPVLIISVYHTPTDFFEIKPLIASIRPDYKFLVRRLDPFHPTNETVLICY